MLCANPRTGCSAPLGPERRLHGLSPPRKMLPAHRNAFHLREGSVYRFTLDLLSARAMFEGHDRHAAGQVGFGPRHSNGMPEVPMDAGEFTKTTLVLPVGDL